MKYNPKKIKKKKVKFFIILALGFSIFSIIVTNNLGYLKRSLFTIYFGSLYVDFIDQKAQLINTIKNVELEKFYFKISKNNYVRLQLERAIMVRNFKNNGAQWNKKNTYFNSKLNNLNCKLKLFGMNPDHFRSQNGHSFRVKYKKAGKGYGNRKLNYINPRSRDYSTDYLINLIFKKVFDGIRINYKPVEVYLNKIRYGIMLEEVFFDKYLIEENSRRESVIFEIDNNKIHFNFLDNSSDSNYAGYINDLYNNNYKVFLKKIDLQMIRSILILGLIINDEHPFSPINLHWYYNPVSDKIEPTLRESFIYEISNNNNNLSLLIENNPIINDLFLSKNYNFILNGLEDDLDKIKQIILNDSEYLNFKNKMVGFEDEILKRENILLKNITSIKKNSSVKKNKTEIQKIIFPKDTILKGKVVFDKYQHVFFEPGTKIILDNANVVFKGNFNSSGTKNHPVEIIGLNKSGTIYFEGNKEVFIDNTIFKNLTNQNSGQIQPSSITFYNSNNVIINSSKFIKNINGDDYVNFYKSKGELNNCNFINVKNDALDSDFSTIYISNSSFLDIGNDAIDGSGSNIKVNRCNFKNVYDKAISAGEKSNFFLTNCSISNSEIGIVSKDDSNIKVTNNELFNNSLDFASFVKKNFYGPTKAIFKNTSLKNYLIEKKSKISGLEDIIYTTKVEKKLYGNLYGKASEK